MQRQLEQIIVAATLAFLLGCHAGLSKLLPLIPALILAAFFLLLLAWGCRQKAGVKLLAAAGIGLCFCCGAASGSGAMRQPQLPLQTFTGQEARLFGRVEAGSVKVTPQGTSLVLACHTLQQAVQTNSAELGSSLPDTAIAVSGKVRVLVQGQDLSEKITGGVIVQGTLKPLTDFANPGGWDGGLWSELQDLQGRMSIKGSELYLSGDGQSIRQYIGGLAAGLRSNLQHTVPGQAGAVLAGMTLGGYDGISAQTREDFAAVGLAHLLAVSGTHIAVVTGFLLVLLRRRNHCTMALLLTLAGYALLPVFGLGKLLFLLAGLLLHPLLNIIHWLASGGWATVTVGSWPLLCGAVYYLLLLLLFGSSDWDDFTACERRLLIGLCCCMLVGIGLYDKFRPQPLTVHFIDVGQGDAALVVTPQRLTLLIDTGGLRGDYDTGSRIVLPYLRYLGIRSLDMLLLSHGHHDHAGGAAAVAKNIPIRRLILPQEQPSADIQALLKNTKAQLIYAESGTNYSLGNTAIQIISAPVGRADSDANESSLIVRVVSADGSIVFTGDATETEELLAAGQIQPGQVLKVSHHGSNASSSMPFLAAVSPQLAVISVGAANSYGHPGSETLQRLATCGAQVRRTDQDGALKITFDGSQVKCYSYRYQKEFF